ncbi:MAG TPA: hypothetical protein VHR66_13560 [Gemmataceae bacterium]|jgi:hypothetical protein|nr:hypothetical protein [Gemmataceae bacterium]
MTTPVDLHPRAIYDAREARKFYRLASGLLAVEFMSELDSTIARIVATPKL